MSTSPLRATADDVEVLTGEPRLLPLLPMVYMAWADGNLTDDELGALLAQLRPMPAASREVLARWLDPSQPPSAEALQRLLAFLRATAATLPEESRRSLSALGMAMFETSTKGLSQRSIDAARRAAGDLESALGLVSAEAVRELVPAGTLAPVPAEERPPFDVAAMTDLLDGTYAACRRKMRAILRMPVFRHRPDLDRAAYRKQCLAWSYELVRQGVSAMLLPAPYGSSDGMGEFITFSETMTLFDLSMAIKFGVQYGLFAASVLRMGTARHHEKYLHDVRDMKVLGCFAMTETGHGSNVRDLETVARYDRATGEFVIHTPNDAARKDYIGGAACDAHMAIVFAQLEIGADRHGVHAFLVPIRTADGDAAPGVRIEDCGGKIGLNGVDNGRLWFEEVRVPRENLLNRFADVDEDGIYHSPIPSASARFFRMLGTLVSGRIGLTAACANNAQIGLTIAIRYGAERRQFGPVGKPETVLLDYVSHQRRLMPRLATAYALRFAANDLIRDYAEETGKTSETSKEVELRGAGLKAYASWFTAETLQVCRECCGAQGYLAENRLGALRADTDVFTTFEGDNTVLYQLVARSLLTDLKHQFQEMKFFGVMKFLAGKAAAALSQQNPIVTRLTGEDHLRDPEVQLELMRARERDLLASAARRLKKRIEDGMDSYDAFVVCQDHLLALARAHVERTVLEGFVATVDRCEDPDLRRTLKTLCDLFALSQIERDHAWFFEAGYIEAAKARAIRRLVNRLCAEVREMALPLVDAFAIPEECIAAPIASRP
jgi:acyl-CoA oxidase